MAPGHKLVPREPTPEMCALGDDAYRRRRRLGERLPHNHDQWMRIFFEIWRAMYDAYEAPGPSAPVAEAAVTDIEAGPCIPVKGWGEPEAEPGRDQLVGKWLSAALDDPSVCDAMKADIQAWMNSAPVVGGDASKAGNRTPEQVGREMSEEVRRRFGWKSESFERWLVRCLHEVMPAEPVSRDLAQHLADDRTEEQIAAAEALAAKLKEQARLANPADYQPDGTLEGLEQAATMLERWGPYALPASDTGQIHFSRCLMESVAETIRAYLSREAAHAGISQ